MSSLKNRIKQDENVFVNIDDFGEKHLLQNQEVTIVPDEDYLQMRSDKSGLDLGTLLFYVKADDLNFIPQVDADVNFDNKHMHIAEVKENMGIYAITLRQNR